MPKIVFEFKDKEDFHRWRGFFFDGGGEQEVMAGFEQENWEYPEINVMEEE